MAREATPPNAGKAYLRSTADLPPALRGGVVAIGNFDGVHRGHRAVLGEALSLAEKTGRPALVLTFEPHPKTWFRPQDPVFRLTPPALKARLLHDLGFDAVIAEPFGAALADLEPAGFIDRHLKAHLAVTHVVTGYDFHFGKDRGGTPKMLRRSGEENGFEVTLVAPYRDRDGETVSSSRIRAALADGDIATANRLLGWQWQIIGEVVAGARLGRTLGYPTANLVPPEATGLRHGVYAVRFIRSGGERLDGVASYGRRPTFDNGPALLETFIFDFSGDLYGEEVAIEFVAWIRPEAKFDSAEALVGQMDNDSRAARRLLARDEKGAA